MMIGKFWGEGDSKKTTGNEINHTAVQAHQLTTHKSAGCSHCSNITMAGRIDRILRTPS